MQRIKECGISISEGVTALTRLTPIQSVVKKADSAPIYQYFIFFLNKKRYRYKCQHGVNDCLSKNRLKN